METPHGVVETPCLVPVATQAVVKTLASEEVEKTNSQILICNTFHLHLRPGEKFVEKAGGLHKFMNWKKPLMTDSGGFQIFSLGFGKDFNTGKVLKSTRNYTESYTELRRKNDEFSIKKGSQPRNVKITQDGVYFKSPVDGVKLFFGPKDSIKIQEKLRADIIFAFDECTSPIADYQYTKKSLNKTHQWAKVCLKVKKSLRLSSGQAHQSLFGIVQGGKYKDLRKESAKFIGGLEFDGFGIGGEFGSDKNLMPKMLDWVISELPEKKPRHLLGIGYLKDIEKIIKSGIDLFDCTVPTHYARRGIAFIHPHTKRSYGVGARRWAINLRQAKFLNNREPLDKNCVCNVCLNYKKNYICHLLRAGELTALKLLTFHNLYYFNNFVGEIKVKIKNGEI